MFAGCENAQAGAVKELKMGMRRSKFRPQLPDVMIGRMGSRVVDKDDAAIRQGRRQRFQDLASRLIRTCAVDVKKIDRAVVKPALQLRRCELQVCGNSGEAWV